MGDQDFVPPTVCPRHLRWTSATSCRLCLHEHAVDGREPARLSTEPRDLVRTVARQEGEAAARQYAEDLGLDYETLVAEEPGDASQDEIDAAWRTEIRRRSAELREDPSIGLTWEEVKERLAEARAVRRARGFAEEAHRQSAAVAGSPDDAEDQAWIDAIQAWPEDEDQSLTGPEPTPADSQEVPRREPEVDAVVRLHARAIVAEVERDRLVVDRLNAGSGVEDVATQLGVTLATVRRIAKRRARIDADRQVPRPIEMIARHCLGQISHQQMLTDLRARTYTAGHAPEGTYDVWVPGTWDDITQAYSSGMLTDDDLEALKALAPDPTTEGSQQMLESEPEEPIAGPLQEWEADLLDGHPSDPWRNSPKL